MISQEQANALMKGSGKGLFMYKESYIGKSVDEVVDLCLEMDLGHVLVKIGDASSDHYSTYPDDDKMEKLVKKLTDQGIRVMAWHYIYGGVGDPSTPEQEARFAINECEHFGFYAYLIDAEKEFKQNDQKQRARRFISELSPSLNIPIGLCAYRFPAYHRAFPFGHFAQGCHFHAPQVYWGTKADPAEELRRSVAQLADYKMLPFLPVGRAYIGDGHVGPKGSEITAFLDEVERQADGAAMTTLGASFWAMDYLFLASHNSDKRQGERYAAIKSYEFQRDWTKKKSIEIPTPPPVVPPEEPNPTILLELDSIRQSVDRLEALMV
jgi:hypothetical protein